MMSVVLRYHVAFYLPRATGEMVIAEALDFPGAVTQGFDLPDLLLEEGTPFPVLNPDTTAGADLIELVPPMLR